jgi:hypothetical protein
MMNRYDRISSLILALVSLMIVIGSLSYPFGSWAKPGPAFLPLGCGAIMFFLSLNTFFQSIRREKKIGGAIHENRDSPFLTSRWPKLVWAIGILFFYYLFLEILGFVLTTFIFMVLLLKAVESTRWRTVLLEAFLATFVSYALFELWLKVQLPKGIWSTMIR